MGTWRLTAWRANLAKSETLRGENRASNLQNYFKARTAQGRRTSCPKNSTRCPKNASSRVTVRKLQREYRVAKKAPAAFTGAKDCLMLDSKGCAPLDAPHYPKHKSL
jgi:hypothetical protein